ncbi:NAD(P)/FAD-dependent oxidoreductase [Kribbella sp. CA-293567]|uniref:NAD(P)/FAD-dependent oxidoreductase n=1 Tax=Kribbella sp. CA-293567 TaxID=3002436 RepID=UPI0022DE736D|nr:FAD-dependent monooxygenase [Kribbella sp. CA-293567]WBQ02918.1 FAD-dependent monooxygenase [Kribbella sp. CA-293567]
MIDLLVAGAGPAGAATAIRAAMAGLSVVVVEPRPAPIDKACGEGIAHSAVEYLSRLGVAPAGRPFFGIRYLDANHVVDARFRSGPGLGVRRTTLQRALLDRLAELDVPVVRGRVEAITQTAHSVTAAGFTARYLAASDGLHSPIRRQLGLGESTGRRRRAGDLGFFSSHDAGQPRRGLRRHYVVRPWSELVEVYWSSLGEAYVTPVADDLVGVAVLTSARGSFDSHLEAFPALRRRLAGAPEASAVLGAGPLRQRVRGRVAGRVLLVGDAAGYVDALTGEGIAVALRTSAELVRCVQADRPAEYDAAWRRVSWECRFLTGSLLWARNSSLLAPRIVPAAARLPGVFGAVVNQLA